MKSTTLYHFTRARNHRRRGRTDYGNKSFLDEWGKVIWEATIQTFQMTSISLFISILIALPLGVTLVLTRPGGQHENKIIYPILNTIINIIRSLPFIILLFFILPFTKFLMGTSIGVQGVIVPLVVFTTLYCTINGNCFIRSRSRRY